MLDIILDALLDSAKLIPFLYVTYLFIEWINRSSSNDMQKKIRKVGKAGPLWGGLLGVIPQCGFSAAAASLYSGRVVTIGTMFAVFLSTSDEMLPVFISEAISPLTILKILGLKVLLAVITGFVIDAVLSLGRKEDTPHIRLTRPGVTPVGTVKRQSMQGGRGHSQIRGQLRAQSRGGIGNRVGRMDARSGDDFVCMDPTCGCSKYRNDPLGIAAGRHTLRTFAYIFVISLVLGTLIAVAGEDRLAALCSGIPVVGELVCALVGLIPNCASSVVIAELYVQGIIGIGPMMAGLLVNAGVGLLILFQNNRPQKQNLSILAVLYAVGVCWGLVLELVSRII